MNWNKQSTFNKLIRRRRLGGRLRVRSVLLAFTAVLWTAVLARAGDGRVEGTVLLPVRAAVAPLPRYPNLNVQPGPPEAPTAVVYLDGVFPDPGTNAPPSVVVLGQKDLQFTPALLPVRVGTRVEFPNHDDLYHNVFSYSRPKRFDLGRYRKDERPAAQVFDQPGVVKLSCEIHEHMRGTILVLATPYFTRTDTNGFYHLTNLPPGRHVLKAWINEKTVLSQTVDVVSGRAVRCDFGAR